MVKLLNVCARAIDRIAIKLNNARHEHMGAQKHIHTYTHAQNAFAIIKKMARKTITKGIQIYERPTQRLMNNKLDLYVPSVMKGV